ncbi:MAG TPA: mechanosensitive ion channel family protein [Thermomicrobiaceae bacterium]|nr:mechanosensitive ion channel family protein [Thermomicrobiaceae bacterium]
MLPLLASDRIDATLISADQLTAHLRGFAERAAGPFFSILVIVAVTVLLLRGLRTIVRQLMKRVLERSNEPPRELALRVSTLSSVVESAGRMIILIVAGMTVLTNLGLDIGPLIASAGVAGIAIGLGAQSLIRDLIGGFFILFEDQFGVGDVISVDGQSGTVELFSLRRTGLRAADGAMITVPNGDLRTVKNLTKDWSRAIIDVDVSYDDDVDRAIAVLEELAAELEQDPDLGGALVGPIEVLGVQALGAYQVTIRIMAKTRPLQQWRVERELRRRIKRLLQERGITIPYPHSVTLLRQATGGSADHPGAAFVAPRGGSGEHHAPGDES